MRHHAVLLGIVALLFAIGVATGYAIRAEPEADAEALALAEWHESCLFYIVSYAQLLATGGDADLRPDWQPPDEWYARWRMDDEWVYLEKDNGKFGINRASVVTSIRWSTEEACGNLRLAQEEE